MPPWSPDALAATLLLLAAPVALVLGRMTAPYGRFGRPGFGPPVPGRLGWLVMEGPTILLFFPLFAAGPGARDPAALGLAALWAVHYGYRTLVYPFRLPSVRPMPLAVVASGCGFQLVNATAQAGSLGAAPPEVGVAFLAGVAVFLAGQAVHHHGDAVLMGLRAPGETAYRVPEGGLYRWVSCVAYLGELVTWLGWALATWSPAGLAMFVFTAANLVPRAAATHAWYRSTFPDYPADRRALIPFVW